MVHLCTNSVMNSFFFSGNHQEFYISLQNSKKTLAPCSMDTTSTRSDVQFSMAAKPIYN